MRLLHGITLLTTFVILTSCSSKNPDSAVVSGFDIKKAHHDSSDFFLDPDVRLKLKNKGFIKQSDGTFLTKVADPGRPFDELIYSWNVQLKEGEGFRLYVQVGFEDGEESPWLYGGYWGEVDLVEERREPSFDRGKLALDQLLLKEKANSFQFKIESTGSEPLSTMPELYVVVTDNSLYTWEETEKWPIKDSFVLDLPHRRQADSAGNRTPDQCQTAALATAMQYYGSVHFLEDLIPWTYDPEYNVRGIWPRTVGAGSQVGFDGYIDRFRTWERVEQTLRENKVILISMTMPKNLDYIAPPYKSISGHIIALNGITDDGRVIVTDSALSPEKGTQCQWYYQDIEKVWFKTKGGVGMVIMPPAGAETKTLSVIPEFPKADRLSE